MLGERHLFVLTSTGQCRTQIKLDYHPTALAVVQTPAPITGVNYQVLVATHTGSLMVYRGSRLVWGAKSDMVPVALSTGAFGGTDGMILAADDRGRLAVLYMGTDPPLNVVQVVESKDLDFEAMDREHQELLAQIRDHTAGEGRGAVAERLLLRTHVPVACDAEDRHMHLSDPLGGGGREGRGAEPRTVTVTVHVSYEGRAPVRDVAVRVACPPTVACSPTEERIAEMRPGRGTPVTLRLRFTHTGAAVPPTSAVTVSATYETSKGEPRAVFASFRLPLALFAELVPPIKESAYKLVLDTNRAPPQLTALFDDMVAQSASLTSTASANVLSVRYACGADATVVVSRTGGRFRVQSDRFHAMWLLTEELCLRLHALFRGAGAAEGEEPFRIDFQEPLPLGDLFELMDQHLEVRGERERGMRRCSTHCPPSPPTPPAGNRHSMRSHPHHPPAGPPGPVPAVAAVGAPRHAVPRRAEAAAGALQGPQPRAPQAPGRPAALDVPAPGGAGEAGAGADGRHTRQAVGDGGGPAADCAAGAAAAPPGGRGGGGARGVHQPRGVGCQGDELGAGEGGGKSEGGKEGDDLGAGEGVVGRGRGRRGGSRWEGKGGIHGLSRRTATTSCLSVACTPTSVRPRHPAPQVTQATMKWALSKQEGGAALSSGVLQAVEDTAELKSLVSAFIEKVGGGATFLKEL